MSLKVKLLVTFIVFTIGTTATNERPAYKLVRLEKNQERSYPLDDHLLIECPIEKLAQRERVLTRQHNKLKTSAIITSWFKDNIKLNQFSLDSLDLNGDSFYGRVKLFQRILKIKHLVAADRGVYSCEIISGSGISIRSSNLTLNVIGDHKISDENMNTEYNSHEALDEKNEALANVDLEKYVRGEAPLFQNEAYGKSFKQLELSSVSFDCNSIAIPSPQILWLKDGKIISEEVFGPIRNVMELNLKNLQMSDSGNYTCQVSNQFGKQNRTFTLQVLENLKFTSNKKVNQTVLEQSKVNLKCNVDPKYEQYGETSITWYIRIGDISQFNDWSQVSQTAPIMQIGEDSYYKLNLFKEAYDVKTIQPKINHRFLKRNANMTKFFISRKSMYDRRKYMQQSDKSLLISNVDDSDQGFYLCFANNIRGYNYKRFHLKVIDQSSSHSADAIIKLFQKSVKSKQDNPEENSLGNISRSLSIPMIIIILTASVAFITIIGLLYCYKNI